VLGACTFGHIHMITHQDTVTNQTKLKKFKVTTDKRAVKNTGEEQKKGERIIQRKHQLTCQ
jgi:hypothetical protein